MSLSSDIWTIRKEKTMQIDYGKSFVFNLTGISLIPGDSTTDKVSVTL